MQDWSQFLSELPVASRVLVIAAVAVAAHLLVRILRRVSEWILAPSGIPRLERALAFARRYPKVATVTTLIVSAITFTIYFIAFGLVLKEFNVPITAYLATASVIGFAVAFGSQSLVQDVVIGLTTVFTDSFNVGDVVEIGGQVGRVQQIGLRHTVLINFHGQQVYVPNRNIAVVSRFRTGCIRAYADVQLPRGADPDAARRVIESIAHGMRAQYHSIIISDPKFFPIQRAADADWEFYRVRFRLWPGQGALIETTFRQRAIAAMRQFDPQYADWMVTVVYRVIRQDAADANGAETQIA